MEPATGKTASDNNGVNVRDYLFQATATHSETLLEHNCLVSQDDN